MLLFGLDEFASPCIDDIIVYSKSWVDHLQHIDEVLNGQCKVPEARVESKQDFSCL